MAVANAEGSASSPSSFARDHTSRVLRDGAFPIQASITAPPSLIHEIKHHTPDSSTELGLITSLSAYFGAVHPGGGGGVGGVGGRRLEAFQNTHLRDVSPRRSLPDPPTCAAQASERYSNSSWESGAPDIHGPRHTCWKMIAMRSLIRFLLSLALPMSSNKLIQHGFT